MVSGMGKVASAAAAQVACAAYGASSLVVIGVAGSLAPHVGVGDMVVSASSAHHDFDARPYMAERAVVPHHQRSVFDADPLVRAVLEMPWASASSLPRLHRGLVLSGDRIVADGADKQSLLDAFPDALAVDMETAAVAQVALVNGVAWGSLRSISDTADDDFDAAELLAYARLAASRQLGEIVLSSLEHLANLPTGADLPSEAKEAEQAEEMGRP